MSGLLGVRLACVLLLLLGMGAAAPAFAAELRVEEKDTNADGRPDEWRFFDGGAIVRMERDRDGDGLREVTVHLESGRPARSEVDRNGDGRPDVVRFMKEGRPDREWADTDFNGGADFWIFYKGGVKDLLIRDKNGDGRADAWFYYGESGLKVVGVVADEDFDGIPDRKAGPVPDREERTPFSLDGSNAP